MTVQEALRDLGITRNYRGYLRAVTAIELALEKEDRLDAVIKGIYSEVARRRDCSWSAVERSLRTLVQRVWRVNRALLIEMAGYPLDSPPTVSEFISIVVNHIQHTSPAEQQKAPV